MLATFKPKDFMDSFNSSEDAVRVLAIVSPNCRDCLVGYDLVTKLFARFGSTKLLGYVVWTRKSNEEDEGADAIASSKSPDEVRLRHYLDEGQAAGRMFGRSLGLREGTSAEDVYLLYAPRIKWENEDNPPKPAFWMHQMTPEQGADQSLRLDYARFGEETKFFLEAEDPDLADKGITEVLLSNEKKKKA